MATTRDIALLTNLLRFDLDPMWSRHRNLLLARGIDSNTAILAESFPDDVCFEFGILITESGRVIQLGFDYLHKPVEQGDLCEWEDITDRYRETPYSDSATLALEMLRSGTKFGPG